MRIWLNPSSCGLALLVFTLCHALGEKNPAKLFLQQDGSLMVMDSKGQVADFVKMGTPRQAMRLAGQVANVGYGINSAGKTTILIGLPGDSPGPAIFELDGNRISLPPKSALRLVLSSGQDVEKMDGTPSGTVTIEKISDAPTPPPSPPPALTALADPAAIPPPPPSQLSAPPSLPAETPASPAAAPVMEDPSAYPGRWLEHPLPEAQREEERFYARTELGPRFMSPISLVGIGGGSPGISNYTQKQFAFGVGYRQDFDVGVWLTDWFGLSVETGFALNSIRGNTQGMTISDSTFWTLPILAQLCFQYPNESGWIPYLNVGFGASLTVLNIGEINYAGSPSLSGSGNYFANAYQIAAGVRYRLLEQLSLTLAYKFFGNSQGTANLNNGVQLTLGSPVTNSAEFGVNFSF